MAANESWFLMVNTETNDEPECLATVRSGFVPRPGDTLVVHSERLGERFSAGEGHEVLKVSDVYWEVDLDEDEPFAECRVFAVPEAATIKLYCACKPNAETGRPRFSEEGRCHSCGGARRT